MAIKFYTKEYNHLTKDELYKILRLRAEVFIVEQNCVYQDIDNKDQKAYHILGYKNEKIVAYTRIFKPNDYFKYASIGRVVVSKKERNHSSFPLPNCSMADQPLAPHIAPQIAITKISMNL